MAQRTTQQLTVGFGAILVAILVVAALKRVFLDWSKDEIEFGGLCIGALIFVVWTLSDPRSRRFWIRASLAVAEKPRRPLPKTLWAKHGRQMSETP
jgi:hypothetical protein